MAMKKSELRELYLMMFPEYPDIVNITQLQSMLGISRHLAYDLINDGYQRPENRKCVPDTQGQCH